MYYSINKEKTLASGTIVVNPLGTNYQIGFDTNYVYEINNSIKILPIFQKQGVLLGIVTKNKVTNEINIVDADDSEFCACSCDKEETTKLPENIFGDDDTKEVTVGQLKDILIYYVSNEAQALKLAEYLKNKCFANEMLKYSTTEQMNKAIEDALLEYSKTEAIDEKLENYVTLTELQEKLNEIAASGAEIDLTPYAKKTEVEAVKNLIPDISDLATKEEVTTLEQKVDAIQIPEVANFVTTEKLTEETEKLQPKLTAGERIKIDTDSNTISVKAQAAIEYDALNGSQIDAQGASVVVKKVDADGNIAYIRPSEKSQDNSHYHFLGLTVKHTDDNSLEKVSLVDVKYEIQSGSKTETEYVLVTKDEFDKLVERVTALETPTPSE